MKKILLFLMVILAGGCTKNEFTLLFELPENVNSTYKVAYYASDPRGGVEVETAAAVSKGKGELVCITRNPTVLWLFSGQQSLPMIVVYAERGNKIRIKGDDSNPYQWEVKGGSKANELLTEWRLKNIKILQELVSNVNMPDADKFKKKVNAAVAEFVKAHPESVASVVLMSAYYDSSLDKKEYLTLRKILDESGVSEKYALLMSRQDYVSSIDDNATSGRLKDIIVQSYLKNYDTLKLKSTKVPLIAYFWTPGDPDRNEVMDSIRKLEKWRKDSTSMAIADISLTTDSMTWVFSVKRDSLRHTMRAISMKGLADKNIMDLEIRKTPWFIVASGNGKSVYSGQDYKEAIKEFRKLKPKSSSKEKDGSDKKNKANKP